jgi:hypothetical protein
MNPPQVALLQWEPGDGVSRVIQYELELLGYNVQPFLWNQLPPSRAANVLSFAPYGKFLHIARQLAELPSETRPRFIHWNFESLPNIRMPAPLLLSMGAIRSWVGQLSNTNDSFLGISTRQLPFSALRLRANKYKYLGDYHYGWKHGWIDLLADISQVFTKFHHKLGVRACYIPWGTPPEWYADLRLDQDIDVLWFGKRRTRRRSQLLDAVTDALRHRGLKLYIADGIERPYIFNEKRTAIINRSRITLNLLPTWYDPAILFRFHMAAGNRSLVVSETSLAHNPEVIPGVHYASAPVEALVETILYYLEHENERQQIADNAYRLVTERLTLRNSVQALMEAISKKSGD